MPGRLIVLLLMSTMLAAWAVGPGSAQAQAEHESPDIFRLEISGCSHKPDVVRYQTGFRVSGIVGLVTALHGVADDCEIINAVGGGDDGPVFNNLVLTKVDVGGDVALLSSSEIKTATRKVQLLAISAGETLKPSDALTVIGYPYGMYAQLRSDSLRVRDTAMVPLSRLIPPNLISAIRSRNSPSPSTRVVSVEGHFLPGESGAPVFNDKNRIVGIVNGGLQEGHAEVSWMIQWNQVYLEQVTQPDVKNSLVSLKAHDPHLVFAASNEEAGIEVKGPALFSTQIRTIEDSSRLQAFLQEHTDKVVRLDLKLVPRQDGGITDIGHETWMMWVGEGRSLDTYDIVMDAVCGSCRPGIYDHLILRIDNSADYDITEDYVLNGLFVPSRISSVGQGYTVAFLTPGSQSD